MKTISPKALHEKITSGQPVQLLDVRTPAEFAEVHVCGAILQPLETFNAAQVAQQCVGTPQSPLYVLCRSGSRAKQAIAKLEAAGATECVLVEGGTLACIEAGLPVERGQAVVISLERQVRIAVGCMVLIATLLGFFVNPAFLFLSAFAGAGLIFAGITDICGLGMVLARMPWNQCKNATTSCCCGVK